MSAPKPSAEELASARAFAETRGALGEHHIACRVLLWALDRVSEVERSWYASNRAISALEAEVAVLRAVATQCDEGGCCESGCGCPTYRNAEGLPALRALCCRCGPRANYAASSATRCPTSVRAQSSAPCRCGGRAGVGRPHARSCSSSSMWWTVAERNHKQTLDELRDELWHGIANACALLEAERQIPPPFRAHGRVVQLRGEARRMIRRARAIDAVRAAANDAEVKLRLWQKRAEKAALRIIAGGSGRW